MNQLKILLLFPNTSNDGVAPLAISILSTIAKKSGFDVRYFETSFYKKKSTAGEEREQTGEFKSVNRESFVHLRPFKFMAEDLNTVLSNYQPDILAVSANSLEYDLFCDLIKNINFGEKKPFILVGGVHATISPQEVIENKFVDAICIGQGEEAWQEFLIKFKNGLDFTDTKNLWIKTVGKVIKNGVRPLLSEDKLWEVELDEIFFDERHYLKPFDGRIYKRGLVELSRGCPYSCSYCVNTAFKNIYRGQGKFVVFRPYPNLKKRIINLVESGFEMLQFQDECFLSASYDYLKEFCSWYGKEVRLPLLVQTRPESVTDEKIKLISDMGVPVQISCGVETGSERILRKICNRKVTLEQIKKAFGIIHKYGLRSNAYTMIGFPTETRKDVFDTINLIREINPDISIMSVFYPFKGVPLRQFCIDKGYINGDEKAKTFTDRSILKNQPMSPEEIQNLRRTYRLYTKLPQKYFPEIELCEKDYESYKKLFNELVSLSWNI
ncbi:MAG: radical SAM protein [Candidatus Methanoperedens sp.]|nr:radical SAM protein [Candidatus Methanoperedens sp.]MCZ7394884.1 radical SAM protein [Candidatus Methanoperedens sp.]